MGRKGARRRAAAALTCITVLTTGCGREERRLSTEPYLSLRGYQAETVHLDRSGRVWVGAVGEMSVLPQPGSEQPERVRLRFPAPTAPSVAAEGDGTLYVRAGDLLYAVQIESMRATGVRGGFDDVPLVLDVRGRFVGQGAASGAVLAFDPHTLEPEWSWAARGASTSAMAVTPQGDVLWHALSPAGTGAVLLERDLQTGRILDEHELPDSMVSLGVLPGGDLLAVTASGDRLHTLRLRPQGEELETLWRMAIVLDGEVPAEVRYGLESRRLAVFRTGSEAGLHVLDAEAGHLIGSLDETPLDAVFSADGALYVLTPDELRRVVLPTAGRAQ